MKSKEQPTPVIILLRKATVKNVDITLSQVHFGKRTGYQANWFETGKDLSELLEAGRQRRLDFHKKSLRWRFKESDYENYAFYFPAATGQAAATKHFSEMLELAPNTNFETI